MKNQKVQNEKKEKKEKVLKKNFFIFICMIVEYKRYISIIKKN